MFTFLKPKTTSAASAAAERAAAKRVPKVHVGTVNSGVHQAQRPASPPKAVLTEQWKKMRKAPGATEQRVSDVAMAWLQTLPRSDRPINTCQSYPHVINHLCGWWDNPDGLAAYFDDLLNSPRKQRQGFPPPCKAELERLLVLARSRRLLPSKNTPGEG